MEECCNPQESIDGIDYHEVVINSDPRLSIKIKKTPRVIDNDILKDKLEAIIIAMTSNLSLAVKNILARESINNLDSYILIFHCNPSLISTADYINNRYSTYDYITDLSPYTYLRDVNTHDGRGYNEIRYGLGGTLSNPVTSICDQDILCDTPNRVYNRSNIFVHEFAHHIMGIGLRAALPEKYGEIMIIYNENYIPLMTASCDEVYACSNEREFFAEASMTWFNVTNEYYAISLINTIDNINQNIPSLYTLLEEIYGEPVDLCDTIIDHCIPLCS